MTPIRSSYANHAETIESRIKQQQKQLRCVLSEWAAKEAPVRRGDTVRIPEREWRFAGKNARVKEVRVVRSSIFARDKSVIPGEWCWQITGEVLKRDGSPCYSGHAWVVWELPM